MASLRDRLVDYVRSGGYKAVKAKSLAKKLGVKKKEMSAFEEALTWAEATGIVRINPSGRIHAKQSADALVGVVKRTSAGDGYIILHEPKPANITEDIFVDRHDLKDAQNGDEVIVRLTGRRRSRGQRCGVIVEVVERATNVFVGSYFEEDESGWVQIDGTDFHEPVWVGDPGAKGARDGDKVVIEMLRFPAHGQIGEAVLTKVLGAQGDPGVDTLMIIHEYGLPVEFPDEVLEEARIEAENFSESNLDGREDLTGETIVTIDPVDARDFDDAISLSRTANGHWLLGVHIADVSHFVQPGTALDREAELRGNSVYLPTQVIPMLPEVISNGLASLQEGRVRFTMSAFMEYTPDGALVHTRFSRSAIRVTQRFAYEEVLPTIAAFADGKADNVTPEVGELLTNMHGFAMLLRRRRFRKGALELHLPEVELDLDADGRVTGAHADPHDESHEIIEEFMLAANIAVATELHDRELTFLRRIHPDPTPTKLKAFADFAATLGHPLKRYQSRRDIQKLINEVAGTPEERSVNYALLRSLKRAEYSPVEMGHFALAETQYCHFTSPIRRYPDLLIHRLMLSTLTDNEAYLSGAMETLLRLGRHCSMTERRAEQAERELIKIKLLEFLSERVGEQLEATITGVERFGFFCQGTDLPAEGLVHISTLPAREMYDYDRESHMLLGRRSGESFRLGDHVMVEVAHVDVDRRELNFRYVGRPKAAPKRKRKTARKPASGTKGKRTSTAKSKKKRTARKRSPRRKK